VAADGSQGVPLGKGRSDGGEPAVQRPMVAVLDLFDGTPQRLEICCHATSIQLTKLAYINMLIYNGAMNEMTRGVALGPDLDITIAEAGTGRPVLILHGGGGPFTVAGIAGHLAKTMHTITPTHPGWNGTERPAWFSGIDDLAMAYLHYLEDNDLRNVLVIGSSVGGWIASEMAVRDGGGFITGLILIDATGINVEAHPIRAFFALDARGVAKYAWHDADRFYVDPATIPADQAARTKANMGTLRVIAGVEMHDPKLMRRLRRVRIPTLAIWGDSDGIVTPEYGAAFAGAFQDGRLEVIKNAGHLPQIEQPAATLAVIDAFANAAGRG
jgi:pimeloyl-ACP methyl ester carboxylesterase